MNLESGLMCGTDINYHKKSFTGFVASKFVFSLSASELGIRSDILPFPPGTVLLLLNPVPAFLDTFPPDILHLLSSTFKPCSNTSCSSLLSKCCWQRLGSSSHQHEEELLRLGRIWVVNNKASCESSLHACCCDHLDLHRVLGVELKNSPAASAERRVKGTEEGVESLVWLMIG